MLSFAFVGTQSVMIFPELGPPPRSKHALKTPPHQNQKIFRKPSFVTSQTSLSFLITDLTTMDFHNKTPSIYRQILSWSCPSKSPNTDALRILETGAIKVIGDPTLFRSN